MSASTTPETPAMKALHRATWFLVHEADTRAAKGDAEAAQSFYAAIPFLAEVRAALTAPVEAWPKVAPNNDAATLAELRKLFMVPEGGDLLVHAKAVADQWMAVGSPAAQVADFTITAEALRKIECAASGTQVGADKSGTPYAEGVAKGWCEAVQSFKRNLAAAPAVVVDEALYTAEEVAEAMEVLRGRSGSSAITDDALAEMERVLIAVALKEMPR